MGEHDIDYNLEIYEYSLEIERMKVIHAISLMALAFYIAFKQATNKSILLKQKQVQHLIFVSAFLLITYLATVAYFAYCLFRDAGVEGKGSKIQQEHNSDWFTMVLSKFAQWVLMMLERADLGVAGLVISCMIHIQMLGLLCFLICLAIKSNTILESKNE